MKSVYKHWNYCFHNRYRTCKCRKKHKHKKQSAYKSSSSHLCEYLRKRYKHKSCTTLWCSSFTAEYIHCRNNHHSCKNGNSCIKYLYLVDRFYNAHLIFSIWTISYHNSHCKTHWIEHLSHSCTHRLKWEFREIRQKVIFNSCWWTWNCNYIYTYYNRKHN